MRPDWLLNYTGFKLELDGYNEEVNIAFEYQGFQHSTRIKMWHKSEEKFDNQQYRDFIKHELCRIFKIKLCIIPHTQLLQ
jgi:hypothetical protein